MLDLMNPAIRPFALEGNFGLEREALRVSRKGRMALTPHPSYGNNCQGPIACDFAHPLSALPCIFSSLTPFCR